MIDLSDYQIFNEPQYRTNLKETSKDQHDDGDIFYMTDSLMDVINFDDIKEAHICDWKLSSMPKSADALFSVGTEKIVFVEFKNGKMDKSKQNNVYQKMYDSTLLFCDITGQRISEMKEYAEFILVYNESKNLDNRDRELQKKNEEARKAEEVQPSQSFDSFAKLMGKLSENEYICFRLGDFEKYCFKKVHTYTESEFEKYLK